MILSAHVLAGGLALGLGALALAVRKGAMLHRKSGTLFVGAMLVMALLGALIALIEGGAWRVVNAPAGLITAYLVATALTTVRPPASGSREIHLALMLMAFALGLMCFVFAIEALASGGNRNGVPAFAFIMFAVFGLLGSAGDFRVLRSGALRGTRRLARHLWRMCMGLWIATASFFLGPRTRVEKVIPEPLITPAFLALPVLAVLVIMVYWLWRVRSRRPLPGLLTSATNEAA